ncbi:MAG: hypothetical protein WBA17_02005 [Saprospiraceae bacterium]
MGRTLLFIIAFVIMIVIAIILQVMEFAVELVIYGLLFVGIVGAAISVYHHLRPSRGGE